MEKRESVRSSWVSAGLRRQVRINALVCTVCAAALILPILIGDRQLERFELFMGDVLTDQRGGGEAESRLALIGIDDASLDVLDILDEEVIDAQPQLEAMSYGFPFPRSVYAAMATKLLDSGARLVVFDMLFTGEGEGDEQFKAVIDANPGRIVLGCDFVDEEVAETNVLASKKRFSLPSDSLIQSDDPLDPRIGYVNFFPDSDLKVRAMQPMMRAHPHEDSPARHSLALAALKQLGEGARIERPFEEHHARFPEMLVGEELTYAPLPFYSIFVDQDWEKNYRGGRVFKDKIVYIGGTSIVAFHDEVAIPERSVLGVQLQMGVLAASLDGDFYEVFDRRIHIVSVLLMALVAFGIAFVLKHPLLGLLILIGCAASYLAAVRYIYFDYAMLLPSGAPLLTLVLAGLGCFGSRFALELVEKARLRRTLERQVSKELADHILSVPEDYFQSLPGVRKPVTVLFSDIRSFTARSEKDDPVALVSQLKEYLDAMGQIVFEHGGVVDKFIGDAVMAVWGNLQSRGPELDTRSAVAAAVAMRRRLDELNENWRSAGREPFEIGIGLNHGDAIFGMMGSEQKQEMTVIGDPVNQAARLESLTKKFGQGIIVGARVVQYLEDRFVLRSLGKVRTMGKEEAEELAGVLGEAGTELAEGETEWLEAYGKALAAFQAGDLEQADASFRACVDQRPGDLTCAMYLESIARGDRGGVLVMTGK